MRGGRGRISCNGQDRQTALNFTTSPDPNITYSLDTVSDGRLHRMYSYYGIKARVLDTPPSVWQYSHMYVPCINDP